MLSRFFILGIFILFSTGCSNRFTGQNGSKAVKSIGKMKAYKVDGNWYYPKQVVVGTTISGIVSWYGDDYHGKKTANGETFNMFDLTSAHKTLPMNTMLLVENLENGKNVIVRVNDRGPFVKNRELDLSKRAGEELEIIKQGTTKTKITILGYNGMTDKGLLKSELVSNNSVNFENEDDINSTENVKPVFIKNTFNGANIIKTPVYISKPVPTSINPKVPEKKKIKLVKTYTKKIAPEIIKVVTPKTHIQKKYIDNKTIELDKSDSVKESIEEVEEITDIIIKPQSQMVESNVERILVKQYYVQVASFKILSGAEKFAEAKKSTLLGNLQLIIRKENNLFRVWVAGFKDMDIARDFNNKKEFFPSSFLVIRNEEVK